MRHKTVVMALAVVAFVAAGAVGRAQAKIDGTWIFTVETDQGAGTPTIALKTEGEKVTGHISSATFGEQDLTGTLKGNALEFKFSAADAGEVIYKCTVESNDAIKGTIDIAGGQITGTVVGKRKP